MQCSVCHAKFERPAHELTHPIDLYHQWLDETATAQEKESSRYVNGGTLPLPASSAFDESGEDGADEDDEDED